MIRVVVVDDHLFYREGVRALLGDFGDIELRGEVAHGDEVLDLLTQVQADVVLLDLGLPGRSGLALLPEIKLRWPRMAVVVVTMDDEDRSVRSALQRGAVGYLLKDASATELHRALTAAAEGQFTLSSSLSSRGSREAEPVATIRAQVRLQPQPREVFALGSCTTARPSPRRSAALPDSGRRRD